MVLNAPAFATQLEVQMDIQIISQSFLDLHQILYYNKIFKGSASPTLWILTAWALKRCVKFVIKALVWEHFMDDFCSHDYFSH